jgi:hypothetical protein
MITFNVKQLDTTLCKIFIHIVYWAKAVYHSLLRGLFNHENLFNSINYLYLVRLSEISSFIP